MKNIKLAPITFSTGYSFHKMKHSSYKVRDISLISQNTKVSPYALHNQLGMKLSFLYFCRSHWLCIISTWKLFFTKNNIWSLRTTKTCDLCTINTSRKEVASTRLQFTYFAAGYPPCKPSRDHHKMLAAWAAQLHQGDLPNTSPGEWNKHNSQIIDA